MTKTGPVLVPTKSSGGGNLDTLKKIEDLEREVSSINNRKATEIDYGFAKLSNATDVTGTDSGIALSAVQNNASVPNTLRCDLEKIGRKQRLTLTKEMFSVQLSSISQSYAEKVWKTAIIQMNVNVLNKVGMGDILITLPAEYHPEHMVTCFGMVGSEKCLLRILENGLLYFVNKSIPAGTAIAINHTYFTS